MIGLDKLTGQLATFWSTYEQEVMLGGGLVLAVVVLVLAYVFWKTDRKFIWAENLAIAAVLGWTSEGMWKVATGPLEFPRELALMTFFVAEALMFAAAGRASWHNRTKGDPGPYGALVWCFAASFGVAVAFNEGTATGIFLRILLPIAVTWLWWTGLTLERKRKAAKDDAGDDDETQWAWTPRDLLVRYGVLKPGKMTASDAQIKYQIRRMVEIADKAAAMEPEDPKREKLLRKLRKLTRTADDDMVREVAERVTRASQAAALMVPGARVVQAVPLPAALSPAPVEEDQAHDVQAITDEETAPVETAPPASDPSAEQDEPRPEEQEQAEAHKPAPWMPFVLEQASEPSHRGGAERPTMEVAPVSAPAATPLRLDRSTAGAGTSASAVRQLRAVASLPVTPTGRDVFYATLAQQLRDGDLRILSADSRVRNAAGYAATSSVEISLDKGTVRKYVGGFRKQLGLAADDQGGEEHLAAAVAQFTAPLAQDRSTVEHSQEQ